MKIWRYNLFVTTLQELEMPDKARIMQLGEKPDGRICLWAEVDPSFPLKKRTIEILKTGEEAPEADRRYIGTIRQGGSVFHFYERL